MQTLFEYFVKIITHVHCKRYKLFCYFIHTAKIHIINLICKLNYKKKMGISPHFFLTQIKSSSSVKQAT
jgi:hypothetical protein